MPANHTPGPWRSCGFAVTPPDDAARTVAFACSETHWDQIPGVRGIPWDEAFANVSLIAAAPEMLEALLAMTDLFRAYGNGLPNTAAYRAAVAAIAKANSNEVLDGDHTMRRVRVLEEGRSALGVSDEHG